MNKTQHTDKQNLYIKYAKEEKLKFHTHHKLLSLVLYSILFKFCKMWKMQQNEKSLRNSHCWLVKYKHKRRDTVSGFPSATGAENSCPVVVVEVVSLTKQGDNPTSSPDDETEAYGTWSSQHARGGNENPWPWEWNGRWFRLVQGRGATNTHTDTNNNASRTSTNWLFRLTPFMQALKVPEAEHSGWDISFITNVFFSFLFAVGTETKTCDLEIKSRSFTSVCVVGIPCWLVPGKIWKFWHL